MSNVKAFVDGIIQSNKVAVFSKSYCPYCHKARNALESQNLKEGTMKWVEIEDNPDCEKIQDYLKDLTGSRSVPRVFISQKFFGGGDDTAAGAKSGKLAQLLKEAGAV
ncbi:hypothetical protein WR25_07226 [Diploscapter pachys]|uniref:Glutaredoxin-1 n=1 Tax=Diploscapter pachys TaxID=2018661 RepID=A0A2A2LGK8_9BILA|nr:hypothetical protein WR25_07226 [Diploscapter pachys]